jgi:predicted nucleotidyltransferase
MRTVTDEMLADLVRAIVTELDPEQVILFGSRARGDAGPASDADLLIVEREPFGPSRSRGRESVRVWALAARFRAPVDILLYSRDEIERWRGSRNHVIGRAIREGRSLYERA